MRTIYTLTAKAKEIAQKYWGLELYIPLVVNRRLGRTLGSFKVRPNHITGQRVPIHIEISEKLLLNYSDEIVENVLKHELCHWALCHNGKPYHDHHPVFEKELQRIGAASTGTISYVGELHRGICSKCSKLVLERTTLRKLKRYLNNPVYFSKCCKADIVYAGHYYKGSKQTEYVSQPQTPVAQIKEPVVSVATKYTFGPPIEIPATGHLVRPGPRGVTNKQMIQAIIEQVDLGSTENLKKLELAYPSVFESSKKYLGKHQFQFQEMMTGA